MSNFLEELRNANIRPELWIEKLSDNRTHRFLIHNFDKPTKNGHYYIFHVTPIDVSFNIDYNHDCDYDCLYHNTSAISPSLYLHGGNSRTHNSLVLNLLILGVLIFSNIEPKPIPKEYQNL